MLKAYNLTIKQIEENLSEIVPFFPKKNMIQHLDTNIKKMIMNAYNEHADSI